LLCQSRTNHLQNQAIRQFPTRALASRSVTPACRPPRLRSFRDGLAGDSNERGGRELQPTQNSEEPTFRSSIRSHVGTRRSRLMDGRRCCSAIGGATATTGGATRRWLPRPLRPVFCTNNPLTPVRSRLGAFGVSTSPRGQEETAMKKVSGPKVVTSAEAAEMPPLRQFRRRSASSSGRRGRDCWR
jgi:hypothetical protein